MVEQWPVIAVKVHGGQTADEAGAGQDMAAEVWRSSGRRQTADVQLVTDVEVNRMSPVVSASTCDVIAYVIIVTSDVRRRGVVDA